MLCALRFWEQDCQDWKQAPFFFAGKSKPFDSPVFFFRNFMIVEEVPKFYIRNFGIWKYQVL